MNHSPQSLQWYILNDAQSVAREASEKILTCSKQAIDKKGFFSIVLAGGSTPKQTYHLLKEMDCDWAHWHIYYGDERCLPENDAERNSVMASGAWLDQVAIPSQQIYAIPAHLGAKVAAHQYTDIVKKALPFDMVLLGMGEDGHTASLFPGQQHPEEELVHAVFNTPKPPPERVSLSANALSHTQELLFLVTGASKQNAVSAWKRGENLPVAQIKPLLGAKVLIDNAAYQ